MNITPLYELKDRLRTASIAGTSLLSEDFRLKKAAEGFKPLEGASPVFKKISELTGLLLSDKCEDKAGTLLDAITLADSVICTLGATDVVGELTDIPVKQSGSVKEVPYSKLSQAIDALTKTGGGQFNAFQEIRSSEPELLRDYRIKPLLVTGLGAAYSELADLVEDSILDIGKEMIPLLKKGFDPKGRKEMLRRTALIEQLGGGEENAFYLEQLESSEKDIRRALIHALRHDKSNFEKLLELTKTEKGKLKAAALSALAELDCSEAADFFEDMAKKKPDEVLEAMRNTSSEWSSRLTAKLIDELLIDMDGNRITFSQALKKTDAVMLKGKADANSMLYALEGKFGAEIEKIYREFDNKDTIRWLDIALGISILKTDNDGLKNLAAELNGSSKHKNDYIYSETITRLMTGNIDIKWFEEHAKKANPDKRYSSIGHITNPLYRAIGDPFIKAMNDIQLINGEYVLCKGEYDDVYSRSVTAYTRPIAKETVYAVTDVLIKYPSFQRDTIMQNWANHDDPEYCKKLADMFVDHAVKGDFDLIWTLMLVKNTGVKNIKGVALRYCKNHPKIDGMRLRGLFNYLYGDADYKLSEAREICELLKNGKLKWNPDPGDDLESFINWVETYKFS